MVFNVAQLLKGLVGDHRHYAIDEVTEDGYPVNGEVTLLRTNRSILAKGKLQTSVHCTCGRCLEDFDLPLKLEIEEEYFPATDVLTGGPSAIIEDQEGFLIGEDHMLDLSEAVRQAIVLAQPITTNCRPECAGLCHRCGQNLNYGSCHCAEESGDERWSPLREMFSR